MSIQHEMIFPKMKKNKGDGVFSMPKVIFINGSRGSGKTTLLINLLMLIEKEQDIEEEDALFFSGNCKDPLLKTLNFDVTDKASVLNDFMLKVRNDNDNDKKYLLILDDCQSNPNVKIMNARSSEFTNFVLSSRHFGKGVNLIVTAQTFNNSFSPVIKGNVDMFFIFQPKTKKETENISSFFGDSEEITKALKLLKMRNQENEKAKEPRTFLYINMTGATTRYFLGFHDELKDL